MWVSYLGIGLSLIAVIISFLTFLFNRKWQIKNKFESFTLEFYSVFDDFINLSNESQLNFFRFEFVAICNVLKHEKNFDVNNHDRYNSLLLKYLQKNDLLFQRYQKLQTYLSVMQNKKTDRQIQVLQNVIQELYQRMTVYYNYVINEIFEGFISYKTKQISKENYAKLIRKFYENIFMIRSINIILGDYRKNMEESTRKQVLNSCVFSKIDINDYSTMFNLANTKLESLGIGEFLLTNNENDILDDELKNYIIADRKIMKKECDDFIQVIFIIIG